jgi:hypothetical protein
LEKVLGQNMRKKVYAAYLANLEKSKMELEQVRKDD